MMLKIDLSLRETDQVFSYVHHVTGEILNFDTSLLGRIHDQAETLFRRVTIEVTPEIYGMVMKYRGIEEPRVTALTEGQLGEPGLGAIFEDGNSAVLDGHHRLVRRYRAGLREIDILYTPPQIWKLCLLPATEAEAEEIRKILPPTPNEDTLLVSRATIHDPKPR